MIFSSPQFSPIQAIHLSFGDNPAENSIENVLGLLPSERARQSQTEPERVRENLSGLLWLTRPLVTGQLVAALIRYITFYRSKYPNIQIYSYNKFYTNECPNKYLS